LIEHGTAQYVFVSKSFATLAGADPDWQVAHEMVSVGTVRQKMLMAAALRPRIADVKCAQVTRHLLWSMPAEARRNFVANAWNDIAAMDDPAVADAINKMGKVDVFDF
jgi:hypothetical protein